MTATKDTPNATDKTSGWRGSREVWLASAGQALITSGVDAVKIQSLANALNISRTSFYWFFKDRSALLDALLQEWEVKNTGAFLNACSAYAETISEAVLNLIAVFHNDAAFEPQLDFAIRGWAHQSDAVASRVHRSDEIRLDAIRAMFSRFGFDDDEADVRARTVYLTQIGYISMQVREDRATRVARVPAYVKTFCGQAASDSEMARFLAGLRIESSTRSTKGA
ncbi:TetR/AcrR family transcriptional regulator [Antarctobacter sp.]|uniref:TetR/AcrR family transcriptional regulator n=1 Tax=Antarctobacter sp. TaxID=1872577 RepID=UPI003A936261